MAIQDLRQQAREQVWTHLRTVGRPDSRFGWNFAEFIADYEGSDAGAERLADLEEFQAADILFITPDNNLSALREICIQRRKPFLMTTYSINRNIKYLDPATVPAGHEKLAGTLDGMELYGQSMSLSQVRNRFRHIDMLVTGGSAVTSNGLRFGKGHGYFDLEWAMFWELNLVSQRSTVVGAVHDCQVVDFDMTPSAFDTVVDYIVTPTRVLPVQNQLEKPTLGVIWDKLEPDMLARIPLLQELRSLKGLS